MMMYRVCIRRSSSYASRFYDCINIQVSGGQGGFGCVSFDEHKRPNGGSGGVGVRRKRAFRNFDFKELTIITTTGRRNIEMCGGDERFEFTFKTL